MYSVQFVEPLSHKFTDFSKLIYYIKFTHLKK